MAVQWRATQTFENADLNFVWIKGDQLIKAVSKIVQGIARQTEDQIGM